MLYWLMNMGFAGGGGVVGPAPYYDIWHFYA
jgi:hypothetical protein